MHIVFICNEYPPGSYGGIGVFTKQLAEALALTEHTVTIVGIDSNADDNYHEIINNVNIHRLAGSSGLKSILLDRLNIYRVLKKVNAKQKVDIIEAPDFEAPMAFVPTVGAKLVTRLHGSHTYFSIERNVAPSKLVKALELIQLKCSSTVVSVSQYTANLTKELFGLKVTPSVIHNSINVNKFSCALKKDYSKSNRLVFFGSLAEKKGVFSLIFAWKEFIKSHPEHHLTIIGKDVVENGISNRKALIDLLGTSYKSVTFIEHMENESLVASLKRYDACVLPSFSEAFALAPLETMAIGLPTIGSSLSSGPELIDDSINGFTCDPNHPEEIVRKLNCIYDGNIDIEALAIEGREKIASYFDYPGFIIKNINFYKRAL